MGWIPHPTSLTGQLVSLVPLETVHFDALIALAADQSIWQHAVMDVNGSHPEKMLKSLQNKLQKRETGEFYPFATTLAETGEVVGQTMFWDLSEEHRHLEIGSTWLHPRCWGTGINTEAKYLMMKYAFETLGCIRVQIKAAEANIRSRKAIEKMGFVFEGILRKDKILEDGSLRYAAYYSMIDDEWPEAKVKLEKLLAAENQ